MDRRVSARVDRFHSVQCVYQFPTKGRFAASGQREATETAAPAALPCDVKVVASSGWYHEEAIQVAERERKG